MPVDVKGHYIYEGDTVAFNRSGQIAVGTIVDIKAFGWRARRTQSDGKTWWHLECKIEIEADGKISTIRNPNGILRGGKIQWD